MIREIHCADSEHLAAALAERVIAILAAAIKSKGSASLVVSGGRTPKRLFEILSGRDLDWEKVSITLADDRLVPPNHDDLNAKLVRTHLLKDKAALAKFHPLWDGEGDPSDIAAKALENFEGPFDVLLLGMGDDGHTASLFPAAPGLEAALDIANPEPLLILPATATRQPRVSLTLSRLVHSAHILLAFDGKSKREVFERALEQGPIAELPVRGVLRQTQAPVEVYWSA
jgi:6-phosphogluconolactonase